MMRLLLEIGPILALLTGSAALPAPGRDAVVLLPFENFSGAAEAPQQVFQAVARAFEARGYRVLDGEAVEDFLETRRIRRLDSLPAAALAELLSLSGASSVLTGTIFTFREGPDAAVAVLLRLVHGDGGVAWERFESLESAETAGLFGAGRLYSTEEILRRVSRDFEKSLPAPGATARAASSRGKPLGRSAPTTFRSDGLPADGKHRVVILPFRNLSRDLLATRLVASVVAYRLRASDEFHVVDAAELRDAVLATGARSITFPDPGDLKKLAGRLGTQLFLTGTIYTSRDAASSGEGTPGFELDVNLVDAAKGEVVWSAHHARKGTDYQGLLELGGIVSLPALTDQVVAEMIRAVENAHPAGSRKPRSEKS
jgi:TolB-like protein